MTSSRPTSNWATAIGWWFLGSTLTVVAFAIGVGIAANVTSEAGAVAVQLCEAAAVGVAVCTALRLPRRARAMFVAGVLTPIALVAAVVAWVIWALSQSNFTF